MQRRLLAVALAVVFCVVAGPAMASGSARFGDKLVNTGDGAGRVTQVAGKPDRVIALENRFGANAGERWEYDQPRKTVQIIFRDGRVTEVREVFN